MVSALAPRSRRDRQTEKMITITLAHALRVNECIIFLLIKRLSKDGLKSRLCGVHENKVFVFIIMRLQYILISEGGKIYAK